MGKIEELKDYLRCVGNSIYDSDEVEKKFEIIAEILLNWCIIRVNAKRFRILEIEFYLFGGKGDHKDIIAYPRTDMEGGEWFFHPSGVDLCFKSHCERKDNHYVIDEKENEFGGILIRSLEEVDHQMRPVGDPIFGPWKSMDVIFNKFGAFEDNRGMNQLAFIEITTKPSIEKVLSTKRHIPVKADGIHNKVKNILSDNYKQKEGSEEWKEHFEIYLEKRWRYYIQRNNFWKNYNANPVKVKQT